MCEEHTRHQTSLLFNVFARDSFSPEIKKLSEILSYIESSTEIIANSKIETAKIKAQTEASIVAITESIILEVKRLVADTLDFIEQQFTRKLDSLNKTSKKLIKARNEALDLRSCMEGIREKINKQFSNSEVLAYEFFRKIDDLKERTQKVCTITNEMIKSLKEDDSKSNLEEEIKEQFKNNILFLIAQNGRSKDLVLEIGKIANPLQSISIHLAQGQKNIDKIKEKDLKIAKKVEESLNALKKEKMEEEYKTEEEMRVNLAKIEECTKILTERRIDLVKDIKEFSEEMKTLIEDIVRTLEIDKNILADLIKNIDLMIGLLSTKEIGQVAMRALTDAEIVYANIAAKRNEELIRYCEEKLRFTKKYIDKNAILKCGHSASVKYIADNRGKEIVCSICSDPIKEVGSYQNYIIDCIIRECGCKVYSSEKFIANFICERKGKYNGVNL